MECVPNHNLHLPKSVLNTIFFQFACLASLPPSVYLLMSALSLVFLHFTFIHTPLTLSFPRLPLFFPSTPPPSTDYVPLLPLISPPLSVLPRHQILFYSLYTSLSNLTPPQCVSPTPTTLSSLLPRPQSPLLCVCFLLLLLLHSARFAV